VYAPVDRMSATASASMSEALIGGLRLDLASITQNTPG
jgi:hypothetical protein